MPSSCYWSLPGFLSTTTSLLLTATILPLAVLAFVAMISLSYRKIKTLHLSPATKQRVINIHALATEGCQLLLVFLAFTDTAFVIEQIADLANIKVISTSNAAFLSEVTVITIFAIHIAAIVAVDLIEGRILLDSWSHPYKWQPFVLTRRWLPSSGGNRRLQNVGTRNEGRNQRKLDHNDDSAKLNRLKGLEYLDLTNQDGLRRARKRCHTSSTLTGDSSSTPILLPSKHQAADLPTPPDSDQSKETKRVTWAPTVTIVSPPGVERRMSLP